MPKQSSSSVHRHTHTTDNKRRPREGGETCPRSHSPLNLAFLLGGSGQAVPQSWQGPHTTATFRLPQTQTATWRSHKPVAPKCHCWSGGWMQQQDRERTAEGTHRQLVPGAHYTSAGPGHPARPPSHPMPEAARPVRLFTHSFGPDWVPGRRAQLREAQSRVTGRLEAERP